MIREVNLPFGTGSRFLSVVAPLLSLDNHDGLLTRAVEELEFVQVNDSAFSRALLLLDKPPSR
jgi:hypothetical protein